MTPSSSSKVMVPHLFDSSITSPSITPSGSHTCCTHGSACVQQVCELHFTSLCLTLYCLPVWVCDITAAYVCRRVRVKYRTCSLMLLMPSGPSRFTACLTRSVRPQLSILKPRSCRNLASVEAASSFLVAQKQSSALQVEKSTPITVMSSSQKQILRCWTYISAAQWGKTTQP